MRIPADSSPGPVYIPADKAGKAETPKNAISSDIVKLPPGRNEQHIPAVKQVFNLSNLLSALKLPEDNLSKSLIGFARFFSLPLESKLLNSLRREALNQAPLARESAALGAAAAADKGLKLGEKALGEYAAAIEGSIKSFTGKSSNESGENRQISDREGGSGQNRENQENESRENGHNGDHFGGGNFRENARQNQKEKHFNSQGLEGHVTEILKEKPLLDLINRIPGKNSRWIVIPFSFNQNGFEFNVSLHILLYREFPVSKGQFERLALDILVKKADAKRKQRNWFISLERPRTGLTEDSTGFSGSLVSVFSEMEKSSVFSKKIIRKELAKALNLPLNRVIIREKKHLFADSREDHLRSVEEAV